MPQNRYEIECEQGSTFNLILNIQDSNTNLINLNSYSASMQIKSSYGNTTLAESLSTANGEIVQGNTIGQYVLTLTPNRTANLYVNLKDGGFPPKKTYVYDMNLQDNQGNVTKIIFGQLTVYGQV